MLACGVLVAATSVAQSAQQNFPPLKQFTKDQITPLITPRGEINTNELFRVVDLLNEDFQADGVALPEGWTTVEVATNADGSMEGAFTNAFELGDATDANNGGYWPVPDFPGNRFAGANDDDDPCDCIMTQASIQMPELDFTDVTNAALTMDIFHDQGFGGGDAILEISIDSGDSWGSLVDALPVDESVWQTVIVPLYDYSGEESVMLRITWTDNDAWASGFALDNVIIGELVDYNLAAAKVLIGDWSLPDIQAGLWDYSLVPVEQVGEIYATCVVNNNGFLDQVNATVSGEVFEDGASMGTFASDYVNENLTSLNSDTMVVATGYTPVGGVGTEVMITVTTSSESGDDDNTNDSASASYEITENVYARDAGGAQAFIGQGEAYEFGNLFEFNADQACGGLSVCAGGGSTDGAVFFGRVYEFEGFDENSEPMLNDIGYDTQEHTFNIGADETNVGEGIWIDLPFYEGAKTLEAGVTYLAVIVTFGGSDNIRTPVSGNNVWPASLLFDGDWGWTLSIPMVRLNMDVNINVEDNAKAEFGIEQNMPNPASDVTRFNYTLPTAAHVTLTITDINGRLVMSEDYGTQPAGSRVVQLSVSSLDAGIYNYTLTAGKNIMTKQMIVK
ncbi:MAG: hypothetical protein ACJAV7_001180 [Flavobacteriales bacterium]|jgi:hypothetical protein